MKFGHQVRQDFSSNGWVAGHSVIGCSVKIIVKHISLWIIVPGTGIHTLVSLQCIRKEESNKLMKEFHARFCGGHYTAQTTTHKILRVGYYWPTIFADTLNFVKRCQPCQLFARKQKLTAMPLRNVIVDVPFQQWGLDFIGEFKDNSSHGYRGILTSTDYFTK